MLCVSSCLSCAGSLGLLASCATLAAGATAGRTPPIVFVHGNGDSAALWTHHAVALREQRLAARPPGRAQHALPDWRATTTASRRRAAVDRGSDAHAGRRGGGHLKRTGAKRSCWWATRAAATRSAATSRTAAARTPCRTPSSAARRTTACGPSRASARTTSSMASGRSSARSTRPRAPNGDEVTPGVRWMTMRSDNNDKYAQPDGVWIGARGTATNVTFDGPALKGATNVVLPGRDHREVSYHARRLCTPTASSPAATCDTSITPEAARGARRHRHVHRPRRADQPAAGGRHRRGVHVDAASGERRGAPLLQDQGRRRRRAGGR